MQALVEIEYSDEEALLAQSASELLAKACDFSAVRRVMTTESGYESSLYRQMAELGWLGAAVPALYGGAGLHPGALASLVEPMGRCLLASPFIATTLATQALLMAGNETQKHRWLPKLVLGEAIGSVALTERAGSYELDQLTASAVASPQGFELAGEKTFVLDAQNADFVVVAARLDDRLALFLVEASELSARLRRETLIDETRRSARIRLDGLSLGQAALLDGGDPDQALRHVERVGWLLLSAEMAGGAEGVMQLTLEYMKTRTQFGKLIGSYQALKHPMVEIMCAIEEGRSLLYHAATAFERPDPSAEIALRMAKAQLGDTYVHAADRAIQFHGAIGFTYECHAQLFFRRAQWAQHTLGDAPHHRRHLADLLWPRARPA
jgi:acyl-CoA dehydrogenase